MSIPVGNVLKGDKYLAALIRVIRHLPNHPRHHGVQMQAHHIISEKGVSLSGRGKKLVQIGYDINDLPNLVFIPCTLQGACHLGVQVHRGNHTAPVDQNKSDRDGDKSLNYHDMVRTQILDLALPLAKSCTNTSAANAVTEVNKVGKRILRWIQDSPGKAPLTAAAKAFQPGSPVGCGGVDAVGSLKGSVTPCPKERNHFRRQGRGQSPENITYQSDKPYRLAPGR